MLRSVLIAAVLVPALTPPEYSVVPKQIQVAEGVVLFITPRYGDVGLDGNSIAIIGRDGVLVFDDGSRPRLQQAGRRDRVACLREEPREVARCGGGGEPAGGNVYPTGRLRTLERLDALDASVIVPGHGEPLRDEALLHATMTVFRELLRQGKEAKAKGMDVEAARAAIMPGLEGPMKTTTGGDPALAETFGLYLVDWYLHRAYDELDGPLTDDIARIPQHKPAGD